MLAPSAARCLAGSALLTSTRTHAGNGATSSATPQEEDGREILGRVPQMSRPVLRVARGRIHLPSRRFPPSFDHSSAICRPRRPCTSPCEASCARASRIAPPFSPYTTTSCSLARANLPRSSFVTPPTSHPTR
ncbi:uncharacterized protein LAESUDRAFT_554773 [Laetiporus sulphureus 93-53]|uniref:Uncharacterized protein n=1 Tax=Laetiporus sulphureus 93-53 TaxID=1314785 RepID=A0A165B7C4_9APHY|nr:uncharacterized protein LAESUDRAFT_554773 [Laetiporus sulphureus 93-53]KZT00412.1 hypothetical protein LAESUDRAFT_554773 [Laetiporus sulphureus 93-53]